MKTPRLALFALALPALLLASDAKAGPAPAASDLPKWAVVDESFRAWPTIYFTVGKDNRALRCRFAECNPETNKGQSNLYVMIESGPRVPIDATVFEYHELGAWDPRRLTGQKYSKTSRVVKAHRQNYTTQLSNFKLDNTGGKLNVVQNGVKYPATTDIRTVYVSETGGAVAVAPPTKKAADVIKPDGSVPPVPPERRPNPTPKQYRWCNPATGDVKMSAKSPGANWTKLESENSVCKKSDGTRPVPPPDAALSLELSAKEKLWLTKRQKADYEEALKNAPAAGPERASAMKDLVDRTRKSVAENLQPNAAAISAYNAAAAAKDATNAKIDAALPAEVWGGANSAIVGPFGERLDIQLSKEEWSVLNSSTNVAALKTYKDGRKGADGNAGASAVGQGTYSADAYDPIQLHNVTMAARAVVGPVKPGEVVPPGTGPGTGPEQAKPLPLLTRDQLKFLTPKEIDDYKSILETAKGNAADPNVQRVLKDLLGKIESRKGQPYPSGGLTPETFKDAPPWHKDIFCSPATYGAQAMARDTRPGEVNNAPVAFEALKGMASEATQQGGTAAGGSGRPAWAKGPCDEYIAGRTPEQPGNGSGGTGTGGGRINQGLGPDAVGKPVEDTPANSWFMRGQIQTFAKGALIGLVIGSLFGPIGLIAGPLIGGALFYGMAKYDAVKADKKEKNTPE